MPPHNSHVNLLHTAQRQLALDKVYVVPSGISPFKGELSIEKHHRLEMCKRAFDFDNVEISTFEMDSDGVGYTYLTLQHFKRLHPNDTFYLILGADSLKDFHLWKNPQEICRLATLAVAPRKGVEIENHVESVQADYLAKVVLLPTVATAVSSTLVRTSIQFDVDLYLVDGKVAQYIKENGLFQNYRPYTQKLRTMLSENRYLHSLHTTVAGLKLPTKCDKNKVFLACCLHDCAKYIDKSQFSYYDFTQGDLPTPVVHAFLGERVAQKEFGIFDREILDAIKYHTTARANMTELEKVVYVADKVEATRPYPLEHLWGETFDETFVNVLKEAHEVCVQSGRITHPYTQEAILYYTKRGENNER